MKKKFMSWFIRGVAIPVLYRLPRREKEILKESLAYWLNPKKVSTYGAGRDFSHLVAWEMATGYDTPRFTGSAVLECYADETDVNENT